MSHRTQINWEVKKLQLIGTLTLDELTPEQRANFELEKIRFFKDEILKAFKNE